MLKLMSVSTSLVERNRLRAWLSLSTSTSRWQDLSLRTLFGSPVKPWIPFDIAKGDSLAVGFSAHVPSIFQNQIGQIELSVSESESSCLSRFVRDDVLVGFEGVYSIHRFQIKLHL